MPPSIRPRDAATLILVRRSDHGPHVLLGQRHGGHVFMPNRYVFPGGRVDPADHRVAGATPLRDDVRERLERAATPARAHALAVAAIRETFEETGLMIAAPRTAAPRARSPRPPWDAFAAQGRGPALGALDYLYRAVTPPNRPRRFNARFFLADAADAHGTLASSGELVDLRWVGLQDALGLPLPNVTQLVLKLVAAHLDDPPPPGVPRPVPRFRTVRGRFVFDHE